MKSNQGHFRFGDPETLTPETNQKLLADLRAQGIGPGWVEFRLPVGSNLVPSEAIKERIQP